MGKMKKKNKGSGGTKQKAKLGKKRNFKDSRKSSSGFGHHGPATPETPDKPKINNPFEIRMHRPKHDNLGRRARYEKGLPGVSRSKAIEKRRETLLKEYKVRSKSNVLLDKRIGEKIKNMPEEEKIARRSVMEKKRQYKQKSIFNLPSTDELLTHKGQFLMNIDRYEDPRDESDSEDERLNEEFVSDAHFAGDFLKFKEKPEEEEPEQEGHKTRKDIIAELILNSKQRKMEKAKEADETYELVSRLDDEFKTPDFRNLLNFVKKGVNEHVDPPQPKKQDYDKLVRELHFETKTGSATNRLKTTEEIEEDELKTLKKLEKERLKRMRAQDPTIPTHQSADDLGDDFDEEEPVSMITYRQDGRLNNISSQDNDEDEDDDELSQGSIEVEETSEEESDAFSDLESEDENESISKSQGTLKSSGDLHTCPAIENDDIPFTLKLPTSYDRFRKLMIKYNARVKDGYTFVHRFGIVLERLLKFSLLAEKQRLPQLFLYIVKFVLEGVTELGAISKDILEIISISSEHLHTLLLSDKDACVVLLESEILTQYFPCGKENVLTLSKVALYQICSQIFCGSDFCHRILSPMKVNSMELINSNCSNYMDLMKTLELVDILYEVSKDSKRYCPEVVKLLIDILEAVALPINKLNLKRRRFQFLRIDNLLKNSNWNNKRKKQTPLYILEREDKPPTQNQVLLLLLRSFNLLNKFLEIQHRTRHFNTLIFRVLAAQLLVLRLKWEDKSFLEELFSNKLRIESVTLPQGEKDQEDLPAMTVERPKMLKLYEPIIEDNFDGSNRRKLKRKGMSQEAAKLSHKVKKEMKSAYREMLKDNAFLAKQQMKEQAMRDTERNRRVKEILGGLANQEGDYRKIRKQKK